MPEQVEPSTTQQRKKNNLNEPKLALDVFFLYFTKERTPYRAILVSTLRMNYHRTEMLWYI